MSGLAVAREMKRSGHSETPVLVAITGYGSADVRAESREAGFDHHFTKPMDLALLRRLLRDLPVPERGDAGDSE